MKFEEGLALVEELLDPVQLSRVQTIVFKHAWYGKSYQEIAKDFQYHPGYIKEVGAGLWQALSTQLGTRVTKHNFVMRLKQYQQSRSTSIPILIDQTGSLDSGFATEDPGTGADTGADGADTGADGADTGADGADTIDSRSPEAQPTELLLLRQWVTDHSDRLILIWGMGGSGKSTLAIQLAQQLQSAFDWVIWRSLQAAPQLSELLSSVLQQLHLHSEFAPEATLIDRLLYGLQQNRCLLILDQFEAVFAPQAGVGQYQSGYGAYGELLRRLGQSVHQSCVVLTSRERALELPALQAEHLPVRVLHLKGDTLPDASPTHDCMGHLLPAQIDRLTPLEQQIITWLTINRVPTSLRELQLDLFPRIALTQLIQAVESLYGRSLIDKQSMGLTPKPVVMNYLTQQLVQQVGRELATLLTLRQGKIGIDTPDLLIDCLRSLQQFALLKATAPESVRSSQRQTILQPILQTLIDPVGSPVGSPDNRVAKLLRLIRLIQEFHQGQSAQKLTHPQSSRQEPRTSPSATATGYAVGNLLNFLRALGADLTGLDLSHCPIWQADLTGIDLSQINFTAAHLSRSVWDATIAPLAFGSDCHSTPNSAIPTE
ncbi:MAG: NB-ARC domain-containing protein [Elainella sp. Prado103]|jgi:hypothetical protein|nr:NB-ARC domain-containing protein [Elainella sp. Prado103]